MPPVFSLLNVSRGLNVSSGIVCVFWPYHISLGGTTESRIRCLICNFDFTVFNYMLTTNLILIINWFYVSVIMIYITAVIKSCVIHRCKSISCLVCHFTIWSVSPLFSIFILHCCSGSGWPFWYLLYIASLFCPKSGGNGILHAPDISLNMLLNWIVFVNTKRIITFQM